MVQKGIKMDIIKKIAEELQIRPDQVQAVVNLIDEAIPSLLLRATARKHTVH